MTELMNLTATVIDKVSGPIKDIQKTLQGVGTTARKTPTSSLSPPRISAMSFRISDRR